MKCWPGTSDASRMYVTVQGTWAFVPAIHGVTTSEGVGLRWAYYSLSFNLFPSTQCLGLTSKWAFEAKSHFEERQLVQPLTDTRDHQLDQRLGSGAHLNIWTYDASDSLLLLRNMGWQQDHLHLYYYECHKIASEALLSGNKQMTAMAVRHQKWSLVFEKKVRYQRPVSLHDIRDTLMHTACHTSKQLQLKYQNILMNSAVSAVNLPQAVMHFPSHSTKENVRTLNSWSEKECVSTLRRATCWRRTTKVSMQVASMRLRSRARTGHQFAFSGLLF